MLFYLFFRVTSAVFVFLYPGYASFKTLSQRPASEAELERWLMYWSVLGCIVSVESVAEWLICWLPFYYPIKTLFLLYLALPQTEGSSWLYMTRVQPFFAAHESEIDSALMRFKTLAYAYIQRLFRAAWSQVAVSLGQAPAAEPQRDAFDEGGLTGEAAVNSGAPPTLNNPVGGPSQLLQTFWQTYGPAVVAAGTGLLRQTQANAAEAINTPPAGPSRLNSAQFASERRRQLEAELASLSANTAQPYDILPDPVLIPAASSSRTSSSGSLRDRTGGGNGKSAFEEVEVPSDVEPETPLLPTDRPAQDRRGSWLGWMGGGSGRGYEKVKTDKID